MRERNANDIKQAIDRELSGVGHDPFLYQRVLNMAQEKTPKRRPRKLAVAMAVMAVLMLSTAAAVAANWTSVRWFLTDRLLVPVDVQDAYIVHPVSQSFASDRINLTVLDAYWYEDYSGDKLAITLHAESKDPEHPLCMETEIGNDGESFDLIWQRGEVMPVTQWLDGREGYVIGVRFSAASVDFIEEETGITIMMEMSNVPDLSDGITMDTVMHVWPVRPYDSELGFHEFEAETETTLLTFTLPPMKRGPAKEIDFANEPNA